MALHSTVSWPMLGVVLAMTLAVQASSDTPGRGGSEALAVERAAVIHDLRYVLSLGIPTDRRQPVTGRLIVRFTLAAPHRVVLDFEQSREHLRSVRIGAVDVPFTFENGHLMIAAAATRAGSNEIAIEFIAGDEALNRADDFLYTLFVPARARLTFPLFDQPDLKARYALTLEVPQEWAVVANGREMARATGNAASPGTARVEFAETPPLPSYLFSFVAGRFSVEVATRNGREFRMFHRETDAARLARNRDVLFDEHAAALAWLEAYTGIQYPWGKFDFVMIPAFQFSGMEHAGAILYNASLFLDASATQQQQLDRATTVAHETAHMWFGNLVTMGWFSDVWMKEVFANFMAGKIVKPGFPQVNHDLRFLLANYPSAYQIDRTAGANPIRQGLANLDEAGQLYGAIIYQKAPIVMRQLEQLMGEGPFRDGLREYLKTYAFGNASWLDLVRILDAKTPLDITAWSHAWVEERGRPVVSTTLHTGSRGISSLTLTTTDPLGRNLVWPQRLSVVLGYADRMEALPVTVAGRTTALRQAIGKPAPLYVLPNGAGLGYGLFVLDATSRGYLIAHVEDIPDPLTRGSAWVTLWDNMLEGHVTPAAFIDAAVRAAPRESDEQNRQRILSYLVRGFWRYLPQAERLRRAPALEFMLRAGLASASTSSQKAAWFNAFRDTVLTPEGVAWLQRVWSRAEAVPGLTFAESDEIVMALELAVREAPGWARTLEAQQARTENPDRQARLAFVAPALSADPNVRAQAFERFRRLENRRREPWVVESLAYLNHPLRETDGRRFLRPGLELLREIQQTGDIFFPTRWTEALLGGHRSPEAAAIVREFLASEPRYPERLRWTVLSSADELFRAQAER